MKADVAKLLLDELLAVGDALNAVEAASQGIDDIAEQKTFRRAPGTLMQNLYIDLMRPIVREHPDLDPDRNRT